MFKKILGRLQRYYLAYIKRDPIMLDVVRWFSDDGDNTLLFDFCLTEESVVFDVGAYHGEYSERVYTKWGVKEIYAFEPHPKSLKTLQKRTADIPVKIFPFGLSDITSTFSLSDDANASSFMSGEDTISCEVRNVSHFITEREINQIDLLKLNIEGGEYAVLSSLIASNLISRVDNIVVQYHTCVPNYEEKRAKINDELSKTHERQWCYLFVWESWRKK